MGKQTIRQRLGRKAPVEIDEAHRARTAALARETFARRRPDARIGFLAFCFRQIGFCGRQAWGLQAALLVCLYLGLRLSYASTAWPYACSAPFILRLSALLVALTALPTLYRSVKYRMLEVETAARIGYARLLLSRLALIGLGDGLLLSGLLAFALVYTEIGLLNALFCLLLPFLAVLAALLALLPRVPIRVLPYALFAVSTVMLLATATLGARLPDASLYPALGAAGLLLLLLCAAQLHALRRQGGFADVQFT